jgi:hypothetical protein
LHRIKELLHEIKRGKNRFDRGEAGLPPNRKAAADAAGLSNHQRKTALWVGNIPKGEFEALIEGEDPPTIKELAERGKQPRDHLRGRAPEDFAAATELLGLVSRFVRSAVEIDIAAAVRGLSPAERDEIRRESSVIQGWLKGAQATPSHRGRFTLRRQRWGAVWGRAGHLFLSSLSYVTNSLFGADTPSAIQRHFLKPYQESDKSSLVKLTVLPIQQCRLSTKAGKLSSAAAGDGREMRILRAALSQRSLMRRKFSVADELQAQIAENLVEFIGRVQRKTTPPRASGIQQQVFPLPLTIPRPKPLPTNIEVTVDDYLSKLSANDQRELQRLLDKMLAGDAIG